MTPEIKWTGAGTIHRASLVSGVRVMTKDFGGGMRPMWLRDLGYVRCGEGAYAAWVYGSANPDYEVAVFDTLEKAKATSRRTP